MADILGRAESIVGGAFSADAGTLNFTGLPSAVGLLVQNLNLGYQQTVNQLFEVGSPRRYYVAGRTMGNLGLSRVVGPVGIQKAFYSVYGDVCSANARIIQLAVGAGCRSGRAAGVGQQNNTVPGAFAGPSLSGAPAAFAGAVAGGGTTTQASFDVYNPVILNFGLSIAAESMLINEQMGLMFGMLK